MSLMTNKDAVVNSCKNKIFFSKNHCEIQVRNLLVCALYSIKYGALFLVKDNSSLVLYLWHYSLKQNG